MEPINSFAHGAFYIFFSLTQLSISSFLLLYKISHHLAQIHNSLFYWRRGWWLLLLCTWGNICWRFRLLGEVRVVLPVGIVGVAILGISCFGPQHLHLRPSNPLLREKLDNALLGD